jgi:hypothetical protein
LADNELELLTCAPMGAVATCRRPKLRLTIRNVWVRGARSRTAAARNSLEKITDFLEVFAVPYAKKPKAI